MTPLKFSQILSSRLCHDLIAPAGAVSSGLEILRDSEPGRGTNDILDIVEQSSQALTRKLVFYRAAFGYSSATQFQGAGDVQHFLASFLETTKVSFNFKAEKGKALCRDYPNWGRLISHLTLILVEVAPRGGDLSIHWTPSKLEFSLKGHLVALRDTNKKAMLGEVDEEAVTPHEIQPYIAHLLMSSLGVSFGAMTFSPKEILITIDSPASPHQSLFDESL